MNAPAPIIRVGHVIDELAELPEGAVQCTVTSPPYWGLRDYSRCGCAVQTGHPVRRAVNEAEAMARYGRTDFRGAAYVDSTVTGGATKKDPDPACPRCHGTGKDDSLTQIWDAAEGCEHEWGAETEVKREEFQHGWDGRLGENPNPRETGGLSKMESSTGAFCLRCPAWKGQLGLEPTPALYVQHIVQVFRGVWRAMRDDGVLWLNLGDSYAGGANHTTDGGGTGIRRPSYEELNLLKPKRALSGLRPKNLMGMPWRVAFALQEDGWNLRSAPVLAKRNPMPESDDSRPTSSYEMFFMLTKSIEVLYWVHRDGRGVRTHPDPDYRWVREIESEAEYNSKGAPGGQAPQGFLRENSVAKDRTRSKEIATQMFPDDRKAQNAFVKYAHDHNTGGIPKEKEERDTPPEGWHVGRTGCCADYEGGTGIHEWGRVNLWEGKCYFYDADAVREKPTGRTDPMRFGHVPDRNDGERVMQKSGDVGRNLRNVWWTDVWDVTTRGYPGAHFATFNPDWIRKPILAATSEKGCCATCGAAWGRIVSSHLVLHQKEWNPKGGGDRTLMGVQSEHRGASGHIPGHNEVRTLGFAPTCEHSGTPVPCVVLDPFGGSGTTAQVARELGRAAIVIEVKEEYVEMIRKRARTEDEERYDEQRERGVAALEEFD